MCGSMEAPANSVGNNAIQGDAGIEATKVVHRFTVEYNKQVPGTAIVADTIGIHIARAVGKIREIEAAIIGAIATDVSRTVDIDLKKSTLTGAFASIMSSTIQFTNASALRTVTTGSINSEDFIAGDIFELTVAVAGGAGSQAQGLIVTITVEEEPE